MANIITDPKLFYRFDASVIWDDVNPVLGVHLRLAQDVADSIVIYNKAYPPPPPGWGSALGTVIFVAACCCVIGAVVLTSAGAATVATAAPAASGSAAAGVNAAAATAATSAGTAIPATATVTSTTAASFATTATGYAGTAAKVLGGVSSVAKAIGTDESKSVAAKMDAVAGAIDGDASFTDTVKALYVEEMKRRNLNPKDSKALEELAAEQQGQYVDFLKRQAREESKNPSRFNIGNLALPLVGTVAAIKLIG